MSFEEVPEEALRKMAKGQGYFLPRELGGLRTLLRPMPEPLWDAEYLRDGEQRVRFFQRQLGQTTAWGNHTKDYNFTNMNQPGQIDNPTEFVLFGFNIFFARGTPEPEINNIINDGVFQFTFAGNRVYLTLPLVKFKIKDVPDTTQLKAELVEKRQVIRLKGAEALPPDWDLEARYEFADLEKKAEERERDMVQFAVGNSTLRIRPGEAFGAELRFPETLKLRQPVKTWVFFEGRHFCPL